MTLSATRRGVTVWLTGLPCAGKSTIAYKLAHRLEAEGRTVMVLDGDEVRERLNKGLGFSKADRDENIRRISYVARLLTEVGSAVIVAAISPYRQARDEARGEIKRFVEVHVQCPVEECIRRDVKGLYRKALDGKIQHFTGVDDPYEPPLNPELVLETSVETVDTSVERVVSRMRTLGYLPPERAEGLGNERLAPIQSTSEA
jgi:adenylyl-sulfate kinase